jgi:uncharacterized membrane protein
MKWVIGIIIILGLLAFGAWKFLMMLAMID